MPFGLIAILILAVILLILIISNIHVVQQSRAYVIERLGAFSKVWEVGLHVKVPFIERVEGAKLYVKPAEMPCEKA